MKLPFFYALLTPVAASPSCAPHAAAVYAFPRADTVGPDRPRRPVLTCRWRRNPASGRLEARWTTRD
jgi:hypothetical protein